MKKVQVSMADKSWEFVLHEENGQLYLQNNGVKHLADLARLGTGRYSLIIDGQSYEIGVNGSYGGYKIFRGSRSAQLTVEDYEIARIKKEAGIDDAVRQVNIIAPMPGLIVKINCQEGDNVSKNQPLLVMEAMKMENEIKSPIPGTIKAITVSPGDSVNKGQMLVEFA